MRVTGDASAAVTHQEIQIGAEMCLLYMLDVKPFPAAFGERRSSPLCATAGEGCVVDIQAKESFSNIQRHRVAGLRQREWATRRSFRRNMEDDRAVGRAAHTRVRNAHHVGNTFTQK